MNDRLKYYLAWAKSNGISPRDERSLDLFCWHNQRYSAEDINELEGMRAAYLFNEWANDEGRSTNNAEFPTLWYNIFAEEWEAERGKPLSQIEWEAIQGFSLSS